MEKQTITEEQVRRAVLDYLKTLPGAMVWANVGGAYGRPGLPDLNVLWCGEYYGLELKRPSGGRLTLIQKETLREIDAAGGHTAVIRSVKEAEKLFSAAMHTAQIRQMLPRAKVRELLEQWGNGRLPKESPLHLAIFKLPELQRRVVVWRYVDHYDYMIIADELKSGLVKARKAELDAVDMLTEALLSTQTK